MNKARLERKVMIKSLKHYCKHNVALNDDQNDELLQLVSKVSDVGKDKLEKVLGEAGAKGKGNVLRKIWKQDVNEQYFKDQTTNSKLIILFYVITVFT